MHAAFHKIPTLFGVKDQQLSKQGPSCYKFPWRPQCLGGGSSWEYDKEIRSQKPLWNSTWRNKQPTPHPHFCESLRCGNYNGCFGHNRPLRNNTPSSNGTLIAGRYLIRTLIDTGQFGDIFKGLDTQRDLLVAIKRKIPTKENAICKEAHVYNIVNKSEIEGFPQMLHYERHDGYDTIVMELLGETIQNVANHQKTLSDGQIALRMLQILRIIQNLHGIGLVHGSIQPDHIITGRSTDANQDTYYLIDLCSCTAFKNSVGQHVHQNKVDVAGTCQFAPVSRHMLLTPSRRDDLLSLAYVMVWLRFGKLPWDESHSLADVCHMKQHIPAWELFKGMSREFQSYYINVRRLEFAEKPNYSQLRAYMRNIIAENFENDNRIVLRGKLEA